MIAKIKKKKTAKEARRGAAGEIARKRPRTRAPETQTTESTSSTTTLTVRLPRGTSFTLTLGRDFQRTAMYWEYVLRNRIRFLRDGQVPLSLIQQSIADLAAVGLDAAKLSEIAKAGAVEIEIPYTQENQSWELRIFPWEFVLDNATSEERRGGALIVIRHIRRPGKTALLRTPRTFMVVESAPGTLSDIYDFRSERQLVQANLQLAKTPCALNPTLDELRQTIAEEGPDVIHLAGIDSHQGRRLLGELWSQRQEGLPEYLARPRTKELDGYMMARADGSPEAVNAEQLAAGLSADGKRRAQLVVFNFYNSAARLAALAAAESALATIGFQDEVDDRVAEEFFAKFYFAWRTIDWDLLAAFRVAVNETKLGGAVVVLWSTRSLLASAEQKSLQAVRERVVTERKKPPRKDLSKLDPRKVLKVDASPKQRVNYSLLQNDADLFDKFSILKLQDGTIRDVSVEVTLYVGRESSYYITTFDIEEPVVNLASKIRFTLTSALMRSIRESVNTVISIKVGWNGNTCYLDTKPIKLLAIDEWVDTPELDAYLPSFVFPRDRSVAQVIDSAQRYLMALNDDSGAGFDGYQGVDVKAEDPFATVDLQALAIWSALSYDLPLNYINPPPTFTELSQRLRTPTDVIEGHRGTCIDLALLLAACLEYIGIYPIIFLLKDHAFPGYWRSDAARELFIKMARGPGQTTSEVRALDTRDTAMPVKPWCFNNHSEVFELAQRGVIVPIESVWLTQHEGFWEAVDEGMNDLRSKTEFVYMIDVQGARSSEPPVTPLPILRAEL